MASDSERLVKYGFIKGSARDKYTFDEDKKAFLIGRDHIGIIPLYQGWDSVGQYYVASELKALEGTCTHLEEFSPGTD